MELEKIVKKNIPFTGIYDTAGFDEHKMAIPMDLLDIFRRRQIADENCEVVLFYRVHEHEIPHYLELTDYLLGESAKLLARYKSLRVISKSRVSIAEPDMSAIGIHKGEPLIFQGAGNKILIYREEDYKRYISRPFRIFNPLVRLIERATYPAIN